MEDLINTQNIVINEGNISLQGNLYFKDYCKSWIIFAHGSGSSHMSVRNIKVAKELTSAGHGAFLFDLLTKEEDSFLENRFNIPLLSRRLLMATKWLMKSKYYQHGTPIGFFGASTGAAAALDAVAQFTPEYLIYAVISRGGRPDLVDQKILSKIFTPTLLIVGAEDREVIELNKIAAQSLLNCKLSLVPRATHLFEEPGALEEVIKEAVDWFDSHVPSTSEKVF